jgi:hypothetical protein
MSAIRVSGCRGSGLGLCPNESGYEAS